MNKTVLLNFLFMLIPLTAGCGTFTSPEIRGKVIDAETGKPLTDANVKVAWYAGYATAGGWVSKMGQAYKTNTNENGEFVLPSVKGEKMPVLGRYDGVSILVYKLGYKPVFLERYGGRLRGGVKDTRKTVFELKALKTEEDYYDGYEHTSWSSVGYDHRFQIQYLYDYIKKYPDYKKISGLYVSIARHYKELGEYEEAKKIYEVMIKSFPDSVKFATEEIEQLKRKGVIK